MANEVDLLSYWMPVLRELKEFKEIAKAEEPELVFLLDAIERALNNMFIDTADEYGIKRFESMMGITPEEGATLDTRRFKVQIKWNDKIPYTEQELNNLLEALCGQDGYSAIVDGKNFNLTVKVSISNEHNIEEVNSLLDRVVPANIVWEVFLFNTYTILSGFTHEQLAQHTYKGVREDIL